MSTIIAYPVTPNMGTREALNAMLNHVAYSDSMGYNSSFVQRANYADILKDYAAIVVPHYQCMTNCLIIAPRVKDSAMLADLAEVLIGLCNDYPAYNDETVSSIMDEELREYVDFVRDNDTPSVDSIMNAIYELGDFDYNDGGVCIFISETDWERVTEYATAHPVND